MWLSAKFGFVGMMKLTDICEFQGGTQPPKNEWSLVEKEGYIRMLQIRDFTQPKKTVPEYIKYHKNIKVCEKDDILIARYGASIGKIVTGLSGAYNVALMRTIPDTSKMLKKYLYYYLNSSYFQNKISNVGSRAAQAGFNQNDLSKLDIICPDLNKQREIIYKLDKIKHVLNNYNKELELLDELVKARFVELFGDVRSNNNYPNVLFSECVEHSLRGPFGSDMKKSLYVPKNENTIKVYIQINAIQKNENLGDYYISKEYYDDKMYKFEVFPNEYIITCDGTLGKLLKLSKNMEKGVISSSLLKLKLNYSLITDQYFEYVWNLCLLPQLISEARNACLVHLPSMKVIGSKKIQLPPFELQNQFADFVKEVDKSRFIIKSMIKEGLL